MFIMEFHKSKILVACREKKLTVKSEQTFLSDWEKRFGDKLVGV